MTQIDDQAGEPAAGREPEGLEVRVARELLEQAKARGVSLVGPDGLLAGVTKTVLQAALDAEMAGHLGYERGERPPFPAGNHRNGTSPKTVLTEVGAVPLEVPRDRAGKSGPQIVPEHARRVEGFSEAIVSLCAKGLTTGEIALTWARSTGSRCPATWSPGSPAPWPAGWRPGSRGRWTGSARRCWSTPCA